MLNKKSVLPPPQRKLVEKKFEKCASVIILLILISPIQTDVSFSLRKQEQTLLGDNLSRTAATTATTRTTTRCIQRPAGSRCLKLTRAQNSKLEERAERKD